MNIVLLCARHELLLEIRSRWLQLFAIVFAVLALLAASPGYVMSGGYGLQDFARTAASLVQLVLLLVPLTALCFGALALTPDRGAAEMLFAQPVSRARVLVGQYVGLFAALTAAEAIGFGLAGLVLNGQAGSSGMTGFLVVVAISFALTAIFLSLAAVLSPTHSRRRTRVLALGLVIWFVTVV